MTFRLRDADPTTRLFLTAFIAVLTAGYAVGLLFVDHTTSIRPEGIAEQFLGSPPEAAEIRYEKSPNEMFVFLHNHLVGFSLIFFALGAVFLFSSTVSPGVKRFLLVEPMVAIVTTFGGIVLVRFVSPHFSWLVLLSGISLVGCYAVTAVLILRELWFPPSGDKRLQLQPEKDILTENEEQGGA